MTYCQHLQTFKSNLLLMFAHPPDARMLAILENVSNSPDSAQPSVKQRHVIVAERDIVQQLMLKPC